MKVVQINAVCGQGSTGVIAKHISYMLNSHNVENYIFYADGYDDYEKAYKISKKSDMKIHALLSHITGKQAYFSKGSTKRLLKRLEEIKPDVVHLHNLHHNYINLNMLLGYLSKKNIKTVLTLHDCWFFTGKCSHYVRKKCDKWKTGCYKCTLLKADNKSWFFDRTKTMWNDKKNYFEKIKNLRVVGVSEWISSEAKKSILNFANICVIHNGIDTKTFTSDGYNLKKKLGCEDKFVILGMGNKWLSEENEGLVDTVLKELGDEYRILLVGAEDIAKQNVIGINYTKSREELAAIYRTADVFVNVTHEDSLPTVNLEAMACGVPVVTYAVCGSTETVSEKTGITVDEDNVFALVEAIKTVYNNKKEHYKEECRDHILKNYNMENSFEAYYEIYKD